MKITFIAYGTRGDVQPALALAKALHAKGYAIRILASPNFKGWIESYGLEAAPARVDVQALMQGEGGSDWVEHGTDPMKQLQVMKKLIDENGLAMINDAWQAGQGSDLIISSFTSFSFAGTLAEALKARHIIMFLQPALTATYSGAATMSSLVPTRKSVINYLMGKWFIEPMPWRLIGEQLNRFRQQVLKWSPQTYATNSTQLKGVLTLLGYSAQVVPPPDDWPPNLHTTGYWFLDEDTGWTPPPELVRFLEAGQKPICIGFGSMAGRDLEAINRLLVEAIIKSDQRAILLSGWAGLGDGPLPANILCLDSAPHGWLFPRMVAVAHHGGAGTTAAGFRAGVPQVLVPHIGDQVFWGQRVEILGVGPKAIPRPKLTADKLAQALRLAATDSAMREKAAALAEKIRIEDGVRVAVALIEKALA